MNFFASPGDLPATRIVVSAGQFPFESDNQAFFAAAPPTVPEPTSLVLLATGGVALLVRRRNRRPS